MCWKPWWTVMQSIASIAHDHGRHIGQETG
jgi:hypothetical protein